MKIDITVDWKSVLALICICLFMISGYALIIEPSPFEWIMIRVINIDTYRFGILVSLGSWSSLLDIVHGYLLDRHLNYMTATWIYLALTTIGCIVYSIAGFITSFWMLILGRTLMGLGVNPLALLSNKHIIHWFGESEYLNFAYCLFESIFWLGSSIVFFITPHILDLLRQQYSDQKSFAIANASEMVLFTLFTSVPMIIMAVMYKYKNADNTTPGECQTNEEIVDSSEQPAANLVFRDYVCMPFIFWAFSLSVFLYYVSIISFISLSTMFFVTKYGVEITTASTLSSVITLLPSAISPFYGLILDKIGHNLSSFSAAILLNLLAQGLFAWTTCSPVIPVICMGFSVVLSSGLWSQFQYLVKSHQYMIAYGVAQTGLNGAEALGTVIAGSIISNYGYYSYTLFQFSVTLCVTPVIALVWILDWKRGNFLNMTSNLKNEIIGRNGTRPVMSSKNEEENVSNIEK